MWGWPKPDATDGVEDHNVAFEPGRVLLSGSHRSWEPLSKDLRAALKQRTATAVGGWRLMACAQYLRLHHQVHVVPLMARMALEVGDSAKGAAQAYLGAVHISKSLSLLSAAVGTQARRLRTSEIGDQPSRGLGSSVSKTP